MSRLALSDLERVPNDSTLPVFTPSRCGCFCASFVSVGSLSSSPKFCKFGFDDSGRPEFVVNSDKANSLPWCFVRDELSDAVGVFFKRAGMGNTAGILVLALDTLSSSLSLRSAVEESVKLEVPCSLLPLEDRNIPVLVHIRPAISCRRSLEVVFCFTTFPPFWLPSGDDVLETVSLLLLNEPCSFCVSREDFGHEKKLGVSTPSRFLLF
jgi:hypothetical protein